MLAVISVEHLSYQYKDGTLALNDISLTISKNSKVAILGPNGAGKTTLLLHLNGIFTPQKGKVEILGRTIDKSSQKWVRNKVGFVFQDPDDQVFSPTVWEDVAFGPRNMGIAGEELEKRVSTALKVAGISEIAQKSPFNLSYGQKKKVAIAGILAMETEIIILDEPVTFLDPQGKKDLFSLLDQLQHSGKTIIIATHDINLAAEWAEKIIIIKEGKLLTQGDTSLLANKKLMEEANLALPIVSEIFSDYIDEAQPLPTTIKEAQEIIKRWLKK
ncbi:MAG: ATP-binding cassette domain-containing protein [Clostridia bacterium]|nr:ATP-binding cassette domain-containing protein [Clostridia bacterium]